MMASKYNKNCIFTGVLDSLCLSCQTYLKVEDLDPHVDSPQHRASLNSITYAEKYKKDLIWKIKQGYYCEICNVVIRTVAKVQIHLSNLIHINNKPKHVIKRINEGVLCNDIFIDMKTWHGLSNGSCLICSVDYDDEETHINEPLHVMNLVQSNVELLDKIVYRKVDENLINCMICNTLLSVGSKESHIESSEHLKQHSNCEENRKKIKSQNNDLNKQIDFENTNPGKSSKTKETPPEEKTLKKQIDFNGGNTETKEKPLEKETVDSDKSTTLKTANSNCLKENDSENNNTCVIKYEKEKEVVSPEEALKQVINFAKQNHMKYKRNSTYCKVCNVRLSSSFKMMKEHVSESSHKKNVDILNQSKSNTKVAGTYDKKPMVDYINTDVHIRNLAFDDIVINDNICVDLKSMHMIGKCGGRLRCHACEVSVHPNEIKEHMRTYAHRNAMLVTPVLIGFENEFIREVRSGVFHCGFCNFVEASLDGLRNHLRSVQHSAQKSERQRRLFSHLPKIREHSQEEAFFNFMRQMHHQ